MERCFWMSSLLNRKGGDTQNSQPTIKISDYAKLWHFKGIVHPKSIFCNYLCTIILINTKKVKREVLKNVHAAQFHNKSGRGLGLTNSKKDTIRHNTNCDPYDSYVIPSLLNMIAFQRNTLKFKLVFTENLVWQPPVTIHFHCTEKLWTAPFVFHWRKVFIFLGELSL